MRADLSALTATSTCVLYPRRHGVLQSSIQSSTGPDDHPRFRARVLRRCRRTSRPSNLDRLEGKLRAVACKLIDESPRSYTRDPRDQGALRLGAQIKEERAEIERRLRPQPAPGLEAAVQPEALRPKVLRRVVSGPIAIR